MKAMSLTQANSPPRTSGARSSLAKSVAGAFSLIAAITCCWVAPSEAAVITLISSNSGMEFRDIASDGSTVFVQNNTSVYSLPTTGGSASLLYQTPTTSGSRNTFGVTLIGTDLYWGDAQSGTGTNSQIFKAPKAGGGTATAIYTGNSASLVDITGLETDGTKLYVADSYNGRVHSLNTDGSGLTKIGTDRYTGGFDTDHQNSIAFGNGTVFVGESGVFFGADCGGACNPGVYAHSATTLTGAFSTLLASPTFSGNGVRGITFGEDTVFATQGNTIYLIDPLGGLLSSLTDVSFHDLRGITYYSGVLYVVDQFESSGRILRVALAESQVPEPATLVLFGLGLAGLGAVRRRKATS